MLPDRIYIIGYMCSGKSSISRKVAARLGYEAYDTDDMFEEKYHICVQDFFDKYGEDYFRKFESDILKKTGEMHHVVVSTGGGTPCFFDNMQWMNENGVTVFVKVNPITSYHRITMAKRKRPLVIGKTADELQDFVVQHYNSRLPIYEQSLITVKGEDVNIDEIIQKLTELE